jgi:hypothetical protein
VQNIALSGALSNNRVTFTRLKAVTHTLHFHGAESLNFYQTEGCNENLFLASYTGRDRGDSAYLLSQSGESDDI